MLVIIQTRKWITCTFSRWVVMAYYWVATGQYRGELLYCHSWAELDWRLFDTFDKKFIVRYCQSSVVARYKACPRRHVVVVFIR